MWGATGANGRPRGPTGGHGGQREATGANGGQRLANGFGGRQTSYRPLKIYGTLTAELFTEQKYKCPDYFRPLIYEYTYGDFYFVLVNRLGPSPRRRQLFESKFSNRSNAAPRAPARGPRRISIDLKIWISKCCLRRARGPNG